MATLAPGYTGPQLTPRHSTPVIHHEGRGFHSHRRLDTCLPVALPHRKCSKEPADKEACSSLSEQAKHPRPACRKTLPQCMRPWAEEPDLSQALRLQQDNGPQNLPYRYAGASRTSIFGGEPVLCPPYPGPNLQKQPTLRHSFSQDAEVGGGAAGRVLPGPEPRRQKPLRTGGWAPFPPTSGMLFAYRRSWDLLPLAVFQPKPVLMLNR